MRHKVLIVTTMSGFLYQFERNTIKILRERDTEIHYASGFQNQGYLFNPLFFKENQITVHPIPIRKSLWKLAAHYQTLCKLIHIIKNEQIDTVHCHNPVSGVLGRIAAYFSGRKICVVYTSHGFHFYKGGPMLSWLLFYPIERVMAYITDVVITINQEDWEIAKGFKLKKHGRVFKIPGVGVDTEIFRKKPDERREARRKMGVKEGEFCLMTTALIDREKNIQNILIALKKWSNLPFHYVICGDGPYRKILEKKVKKLGLEKKVTFLGYCSDICFLLQGADVFVFPSLREGLGMAALEAMACEIPVVASSNRGSKEYIRHGENGILCRNNCSGDFGEALKILWKDAEKRKLMGIRAREDSFLFSCSKAREHMENIYRFLWEEGNIYKNGRKS